MKTVIVIPARYGSKRFPGKPLAILEGKTILQRVWDIASFVCTQVSDCTSVVATEPPSEECPSNKIISFCECHKIPVIITPSTCRSGSDRVWSVVSHYAEKPDIIVNLQGDVPTCPPDFIINLIGTLRNIPQANVATIYTKLRWESLDALRVAKQLSPFSGTTLIVNQNGEALWFSKKIIPAIRDEDSLRQKSEWSPICRHVGVYAYRYDALQTFAQSVQSQYEELEQLEQLRFLENGLKIIAIEGSYPCGYEDTISGIDSVKDLEYIAQIIRKHGEILTFYQ